jgi:acyl dehydratase
MTNSVTTLKSRTLREFTTTVTREALQRFAMASSNNDTRYVDLDAAQVAGFRDLPVPPTYLVSLEFLRPDPYGVLDEIGVKRSQSLHGEQSIVYDEMCFAGDTLTFSPRIVDDYERKSGALRFLVRETVVTRTGERVALLRNVLAILRGDRDGDS